MLLKEKILEQYPSIANFCFINDISKGTIGNYLYNKIPIDSMSAKTLSKICTALNCDPEDIEFTKSYWREFTYHPKTRKYVYDLPHKINL